MENKPVISVHGDQQLLSSIKNGFAELIRKESTEWRRSYGRPVRHVHIDIDYCDWNAAEVKRASEQPVKLLSHIYLHTYWTDCNDIECYKATVREDINSWLLCLRSAGISDWLIIVAVNSEKGRGGKQSKLLSRNSLYEKVKGDFCTRQNDKDRCLLLHEPLKNELRSSESWQQLVTRFKAILIRSYNRHLLKYEELIAKHKEMRNNEPNWDFIKYFCMEEELSTCLEMFGLYEDALSQCDNLDAMFVEAVHRVRVDKVVADWLKPFTRPISTWDGMSTSATLCNEKRSLITSAEASVLDFRSYIFSKHAAILLLLCRPWEIAQTAFRYMHSAVREVATLQVPHEAGCVECWVILSCLHVISTCDRFKDTTSVQLDNYARHTADLYSYATTKCSELGTLCGLTGADAGQQQPNSQQLHLVVQLLSGITSLQTTPSTLATAAATNSAV